MMHAAFSFVGTQIIWQMCNSRILFEPSFGVHECTKMNASSVLGKIKFMRLLFIALLGCFICSSFSPSSLQLKPQEQELYDLLNAYRKQRGLRAIPLSSKLTQVARLHVYDLETNQPATGRCNLHSWSNKGKWKGCCYTGNEASAKCMWNKPKELTDYPAAGFEIAAFATNMSPQVAMEVWKSSRGHNAVMINKGTWNDMNWQAVGVGISDDYAVIWFGTVADDSAATH
jgi:hypothetical protein